MNECALLAYYQEFRTALFVTGFTMGTFLFSMKSVIMKTMKDEYYDLDEYQKPISKLRKLGVDSGYYDNLLNLSRLIVAAISICILGAILQITIGYIGTLWAAVVCLFVSAVSWVLVGISVYHVGENWKKAIQFSEQRARLKHERESSAAEEKSS